MMNLITPKILTPAFIPNIGPTELIVLLVVVLLIFGPKNLPKLGKALGRGMREFKDASNDLKRMVDMDDDEDTRKQYTAKHSAPAADTTTSGEESDETESAQDKPQKKEKPIVDDDDDE